MGIPGANLPAGNWENRCPRAIQKNGRQHPQRWPVSGLGELSFAAFPVQGTSGIEAKVEALQHSFAYRCGGSAGTARLLDTNASSLLPVELRLQKSHLEHQQPRIVARAAHPVLVRSNNLLR